jgi:hypothetical protein
VIHFVRWAYGGVFRKQKNKKTKKQKMKGMKEKQIKKKRAEAML